MKPYKKEKTTFQEYAGNRWWKNIKTYLKNKGVNVSKKLAKRLV